VKPMTLHNPTYRVVKILNAVSERNGSLSLSSIAKVCGIPVGTILPILRTLCEAGYLSCDPETKTYAIGIRCFLTGTAFTRSSSSYEGVSAVVRMITDRTMETAQYGLLEGGNVLYVAKSESPQPVRMYAAIGRTLPAYGTAIGKALLSGLENERVRELYSQGLAPLTEHTITRFDELFLQLDQIRKGGFAEECEESNLGIRCLAMPVHDRGGKVVGAVSVVIPLFRFSEQKAIQIKDALRAASKNIEAMIPLMVS